MGLENGTKLGPYEILSPLGAGGMGEVYRATDTRLDRDVALKVLPSHLTTNIEFKQRFEREAKSISQLSHSNICTLHDIGNENGVDFLVMELLEGESLARRLDRGRLDLDDVLRYGIEIASALDTAHRAGIIHRDLKPGNIMLTKSGAKLLDFGLAKAAPGQSGLSTDPDTVTITEPLTGKGTIVGTFQYMAPEQLEGKDADHRTDIFSFGAVLYEMATGRRAFEGSSRASLIASIMSSQPRAISELQPMTPPALEFLVRGCLTKSPDDRIQTAHDVALQLRWIREGGSQLGVSAVTASTRRGRGKVAWTLAVIGCVLFLAMGAWVLRLINQRVPTYRMSVMPPEDAVLVSSGEKAGTVALSPDGSRMAFVARRDDDRQQVWIRSLDQFNARPLAGTEGASRLFWSPDGRKLGFFADGKLKTIDAGGGPAIAIADAPSSRGGSWNQDGVIVFAPTWNAGLMRVSASGGPVEVVTTLDEANGEATHRYPWFLPDGRHFLYLARRAGAGSGDAPAIILTSLDSSEKKKILSTASSVAYASGHLLYAQQRTLMAVRFDTRQLAMVGEPFPIADNLFVDERFSLAVFSVSQNGIVAYRTGEATLNSQLMWIDRNGKQLSLIGEPEPYQDTSRPSLSPDGSRVLVSIQDLETGVEDIWIRDLVRNIKTRFTVGQLDGRLIGSFGAIWSPDGTHVVYGRLSGIDSPILQRIATGAGAAETVLDHPGSFAKPCSYSADGKFFMFEQRTKDTRADLWFVSLGNNSKPEPYANSRMNEGLGQFSPDGKFVAFVSNMSGRREVYVASFPDRHAEWQISNQGGTEPRWRRDGGEVYFFDPQNWLNATKIEHKESSLEIGTTTKLFQGSGPVGDWRYDVAPDGERFIVTVPSSDEAASPIYVIVNWLAERGDR